MFPPKSLSHRCYPRVRELQNHRYAHERPFLSARQSVATTHFLHTPQSAHQPLPATPPTKYSAAAAPPTATALPPVAVAAAPTNPIDPQQLHDTASSPSSRSKTVVLHPAAQPMSRQPLSAALRAPYPTAFAATPACLAPTAIPGFQSAAPSQPSYQLAAQYLAIQPVL